MISSLFDAVQMGGKWSDSPIGRDVEDMPSLFLIQLAHLPRDTACKVSAMGRKQTIQ